MKWYNLKPLALNSKMIMHGQQMHSYLPHTHISIQIHLIYLQQQMKINYRFSMSFWMMMPASWHVQICNAFQPLLQWCKTLMFVFQSQAKNSPQTSTSEDCSYISERLQGLAHRNWNLEWLSLVSMFIVYSGFLFPLHLQTDMQKLQSDR